MSNGPKTRVTIPPADNPRSHRRVAALAGLGLAIGLAWPVLAGKHLGPNVPGLKKDGEDEAAAAASSSASPAKPKPAPTGVALSKGAPAEGSAASDAERDTDRAPAATKQSVVVDGGTISACWHGKEKLEGDRCGTLKLDKTVVPVLRQLGGCPSALGLTGDLTVVLDLDFGKKTNIQVKKGKNSAPPAKDGGDGKPAPATELPSSTVTGVLGCVADYVRDLSIDKLAHDHDRYLIEFPLHFRAHGDAPTAKSEEDAPAAAEPATDDVATIAWDAAVLRDEPRTGKSVGRLVRGTRVKILGSRKDWFEVKMGNRQGWVYRAALGR